MHYNTIIAQLFTELDALTHAYVFNGYKAMSHALALPLFSAGVIAISLLGLSISMGWVKGSLQNLTKLVIKISLVYAFTMNWGVFSQYVYTVMTEAGGELGQQLIQATPLPIPIVGGTGINGALQFAFNEFIQLGHLAWSEGSIGLHTNIQPYIGAVIILASGIGMVLVGLFELALAKIMTALLLATAPLFIGFTLFKPTQTFFDRWLGSVVGFALLPVFVSAMIALSLAMSQLALAGAFAKKALNIDGMDVYIVSATVGLLGMFVIQRAASLAQSIGGSVSTSGVGGFVAGAVMGAMSQSRGLMNHGKNLLQGGANLIKGITGKGEDIGKRIVDRYEKNKEKKQARYQGIRQQTQRGDS